MEITTIGLDLAKSVFQVHAIAARRSCCPQGVAAGAGAAVLYQAASCLVGMEACGTSHHWARELDKLGHEVRLMPPAYVKPYVKRGQDRCGGCRGDLRGGDAPDHALRAGEVGRAAGGAGAASDARSAGQAAHAAGEHDPRSAGRVRHRDPRGHHARAGFVRRAVAGEAPEVPALAAKVIASLGRAGARSPGPLRELERELLAWHRSNESPGALRRSPAWACSVQRRSPPR